MINEGQLAPAFTVKNQDGEDVSLGQFEGKNVVLYFYPKDNTPGCTTEAIDFTASIDAFKELNTEILGVSKDSVSSHRSFCDKHSLGITLLSDPDMSIIEPYGVWQEKKNYGKTYMGIVRTTVWITSDNVIKKIWSNVRVKNHVNAVLDEIKRNVKGANDAG